MTWVAWRGLRLQAIVVSAGLALFSVLLVVSTRSVGETTVYTAAWGLMLSLPALLGVFWGAPLIARELETGTYRLAWSQSVSRNRWLATKLGVGVLGAMAAAGVATLVATWWCAPIEAAINAGHTFDGVLSVSRMEPPMFVARGLVPVGYAAFAFVGGATAGLLLRRTVPAMAVTLLVYVAVQFAIPHLRAGLAPEQLTTKLTQQNLLGLIINNLGDPVRDVRVRVDRPGAWITRNTPVDPRGRLTDTLPGWVGSCVPVPGQPENEGACFARLDREGYRQRVTYQPASRYWAFQAYETAFFLALAGGLAAVCFWRIRRPV